MKILWTEGAIGNFDRVEEYIALDNPRAAVATVRKVIEVAQVLADYPTMGKRGREPGTRELVVVGLPFVVIYAVHREELVILRVLHTSMKYP